MGDIGWWNEIRMDWNAIPISSLYVRMNERQRIAFILYIPWLIGSCGSRGENKNGQQCHWMVLWWNEISCMD